MPIILWVDKFIPYFYQEKTSIFHYIDRKAIVLVEDVSRMRSRLSNVVEEHYRQCEILMEKGMLLSGSYSMYFDPQDLPRLLDGRQVVHLNSLDEGRSLTDIYRNVPLQGKNVESYQGYLEELKKDLHLWLKQGYLITMMAATDQRVEGLYQLLSDDGIRVYKQYPADDFPCVVIRQGLLENGFIYPEIKWAVVCESDIGAKKRTKAHQQFKDGRKINVFTDLQAGDYVVHQTHGIGHYIGIESLEVEGLNGNT